MHISQRIDEQSQTLHLLLYSGIGLTVLSMLFLGRDLQTNSFVLQAALTLAVPLVFYIVGWLALRYLDAPLAAPGLVATGAWLVGVSAIHLYLERGLLPPALQPIYWPVAAVLTALVITLTGHRVRVWLLFPLVPLVQVNALWSLFSVSGVPVIWWAALSFVLVVVWSLLPLRAAVWQQVYRVSAFCLTLFLLLYAYLIPGPHNETLISTWLTVAGPVALHNWRDTSSGGTLPILMVAAVSAWSLPVLWWPLSWLLLAAVALVVLEVVLPAIRDTNFLTLFVSKVLCLVLSIVAVLLTKLLPLAGMAMNPLLSVLVLLGTGLLLLWLGWRWRQTFAVLTHVGLWLVAWAWADAHLIAVGTSDTFGLWLSLLAVLALLTERASSSRHMSLRRAKQKETRNITETVLRWPLADLIIGLTGIIVLWSALSILTVDPAILMLTLLLVVGIWIGAGLIYRLPVFIHLALWIAPIPYAFLLVIYLPVTRSLPVMGMAWQVLGLLLLVIAHANPRYRPTLLLPFFIVGYVLLGFGFTLTSDLLLPLSLGLIVLVSLLTSVLVMFDLHPVWSWLVARVMPPATRPFGYKNAHNIPLLLAAWLLVIWLQIMLGYTNLTLPQQGLALVLLSGLWFLLGRLLPHLPGVAGWTVYSAGWFMWLIGLLQVFFSPTQAVIAAIFGLLFSGEAIYRTRLSHWIPLFVLQGLFSVLQLTHLLALPAHTLLTMLAVFVGMAGLYLEGRNRQAGRITAMTGTLVALALWLWQPDVNTTLSLLVLTATALLRYRHWGWLLPLHGAGLVLLIQIIGPAQWWLVTALGFAELLIGGGLYRALRPRRHRKLARVLFADFDWATPFLWWSGLLLLSGVMLAGRADLLLVAAWLTTAGLTAVTLLLSVRHAPELPLWSIFLLLTATVPTQLVNLTRPVDVRAAVMLSVTLAAAAFGAQMVVLVALRAPRPFGRWRGLVWWLRPLLVFSRLLLMMGVTTLGLIWLFSDARGLPLAANAALLTGFFALGYTRRRAVGWLWGALVLGCVTWAMLLAWLGVSGLLWITLPLSIVLMALAIALDHPDDGAHALEILGIFLLLVSSAWVSSSLPGLVLLLGGELLALLLYGCVVGRRVPFLAGLTLLTGGGIAGLLLLNVWLLPLASGLLLLGAALLLEVRREHVTQFVTAWRGRWHTWR